MEFAVIPDYLYGASVRVNGKWLGIVEERPVKFRIGDVKAFTLLVEVSPLQSDPTGDVTAVPFARVIKIKDGAIVPPEVEPDGALHVRKTAQGHELHFVYPKVEVLGQGLETLLVPKQTESADFDHDGRLDVAETFATNLRGHVRVRSATGRILLQEVYPDNELHIAAADLNRDGRPDLLIFWRGALDEPLLQLWDGADGSISTFAGFTGIRRTARAETLLEKKVQTPFREWVELYRFQPVPHESPQFKLVRTEDRTLQRADVEGETLEAFLSSFEAGDRKGAMLYLTKGTPLPELNFYAHEIDRVNGGNLSAMVYHWIEPGYYDEEHVLAFDLVRQPDAVSEWKIKSIQRRVHGR
ncbi:hypothetical protein EV586_102573 [Tumebacillus sp. BK434]|uniref:FG-GAP repeat domain-containing protein n=1 Tax=Tumebacillus sp. BK434 TaxID=2512169 RepID=UPI0010524F53|nr:VCBS repeat-containing protein [Tumebacillus sp. BK434]TCP58122.1 hypothetical protein EV586_102573 [Tumebacillus sp. BK434]